MLRGGGNSRGTALPSNFRGNPMSAHDRLPQPLRRALQDALLDWCPLVERWRMNKLIKAGVPEAEAAERLAQGIREADARQMEAMRYAWPARFGRCPAIAAEATMLRYDEVDRVRARRRGGVSGGQLVA
jgi:hypothetical protein